VALPCFGDLHHISNALSSFNKQRLLPSFTTLNFNIMQAVITDPQLDTELQELYIISSHWKSDISFVQDEIRFLKSTLNKYSIDIDRAHLHQIIDFNDIVIQQETTIPTIQTRVTEFIRSIEPIIKDSKKAIGLDTLENFNSLDTEIKAVANYVLKVKNLFFLFIDDVTRIAKQNSVLSSKKLPLKYSL
jgi:hypothetical protein